jgi:hypothetical protein
MKKNKGKSNLFVSCKISASVKWDRHRSILLALFGKKCGSYKEWSSYKENNPIVDSKYKIYQMKGFLMKVMNHSDIAAIQNKAWIETDAEISAANTLFSFRSNVTSKAANLNQSGFDGSGSDSDSGLSCN